MRFVLPMVLFAAFVLRLTGAEEKVPVPDAAAQQAALKTVKEVFADDYKKPKPEEKAALAATLLKQGIESKDEPATQYVLLQEAAGLAVQVGDAETAINACGETVKYFKVNGAELKLKTFEAVSRNLKTLEANKALVQACLAAMDEAVAADGYEDASRMATLAEGVARKTKELPLISQIQAKAKEIRELQGEFAKVKAAKEVLFAKPDDAEASLAVGKFLCFVKADWDKGLPLLAKCSDTALKALAEKDLAQPRDAKEQMAVADGWWDLAEKQNSGAKTRLQQRAVDYYNKALPNLTGLNKVKVEKRITQTNSDVENMLRSLAGTWVERPHMRKYVIDETGNVDYAAENLKGKLVWDEKEKCFLLDFKDNKIERIRYVNDKSYTFEYFFPASDIETNKVRIKGNGIKQNK
jgi:hypothetical protein